MLWTMNDLGILKIVGFPDKLESFKSLVLLMKMIRGLVPSGIKFFGSFSICMEHKLEILASVFALRYISDEYMKYT